MENVLRKNRLFEFMERLTAKKGDNVAYEEAYHLYDDIKKYMENNLISDDKKGHQLLIIDPYLLAGNESNIRELIDFIKNISPSEVVAICRNDVNVSSTRMKDGVLFRDFNDSVAHLRTELQGINFYVIPCDGQNIPFHDRFWIFPRFYGIVVGTSFNGICKGKMIYMAELTPKEIDDICDHAGI